jgi:protocatechuate 3,4-dioxygenase beta subunit
LRARARLLPFALFLVLSPSLAAPAEPPRTPISVGGLVQGPGGSPLEGARALLVPMPSDAALARLELEGKVDPEPAASIASTTTRADGTFRLEAPEPGMWKVMVQAPGLVPREIELLPLFEETELPAVKLEKDAGLEVRVTGSDGAPVAGARVRTVQSRPFSIGVQPTWKTPVRAARTDAKGVAVLPREGRERVTVLAGMDGLPYAEQEARSGAVILRLLRPASGGIGDRRQIRVLDITGKKPVADAWVRIGKEQWCAGRTSADGLFDVPLASGTRQTVLVLAEDGRRLETSVEPLKKGETGPKPVALPALEALAGRVVSVVDGKPVAGALVWFKDPGTIRRTGADGAYRIELAPSAAEGLWVQAAAPGYFVESGQTIGPAGRRQGPVLALTPALAAAGVVVDEKGVPVGGVEILASPQPGDRFDSSMMRSGGMARTTPAGRFRVSPLAAGIAHDLRLSRTGFAPASFEVPPLSPIAPGRPAADLRIVLRRGRTGFGRVVTASEQPIAGARVSVRRDAGGDMRSRMRMLLFGSEETVFEGVTGADGRFEVRDLPAGSWSLEARASGYAALTVPGLTVPEGAGSTDFGTLMLPAGVAVEGYVVDPRGRPVEGAEVNAVDGAMSVAMMRFGGRQNAANAADTPAAITGADGYFRIEDRRAGETINLDASRAGYARSAAPGVRVPSEEPVRIVLQPASAVEGRVVDGDGKPVAGARVVVIPTDRRGGFQVKDGTSDDSGAFRVEDVPPGAAEARTIALGFQPSYLSNLEVRAGQDLKGVEIVLAAGAVVEGRVLSPSGRPVAGADVRVFEAEEGGGRRFFSMPIMAQSDGEGRYRLEGVAPGTRTLQAEHKSYRRAVRDLEVRPGENTLDLSLEGGAEVRGRVVDESGTPVPGARVSLHEGWRSWDLPSGVSGADGGFTLEGVADGTYRLLGEKEGFASDEEGQEVVVAGSSVGGMEVKLSRGGAVTGQLLGLDFTDLAQVRIRSEGSGTVRADGSYRVENLAPGKQRIVASLPGGTRQAEGEVELEPGVSEVRLDLDFGQGVTLTGRVLRNGEPLAGEMVSVSGAGAGRWGETDHEGRFRFEALAEGSYELAVMSRGGARHQENLELAGDRDVLIDLRTVSISGRVADAADRSPIASAAVTLLPKEGEGEAGRFFPVETSTDSRGVFRLSNVPEGAWRVRVSQEGYTPAEEDVQVADTPVDGMEIALQATEGLTLEVVLPNGRPPSQVHSAILDPSGRVVSTGLHTVRETGRVRISSVAPGAWELVLEAEGWAPVSVPVTAPGDAGRVVLATPGSLRVEVPALADGRVGGTVRFTDAAGRVFRTLWGNEAQSEFTLQNGSRELQRIPVGNWSLTVTAADGRTWSGTAAVTAGGKAVVKLE